MSKSPGINSQRLANLLTFGTRRLSLLQLVIPVLLGIVLFCFTVYALSDAGDNNVVFVPTTTLSYVSLGLFVICLVAGLLSDALYITLLVFVLLAFPSPVDDLWPGIFLGQWSEIGASVFPFFTHIDIYLLAGILKGLLRNPRLKTFSSPLPLLVVSCLFVSITVNFFTESTRYERLLLVAGTYQFRYLIELLMLFYIFDITRFKKGLMIGFVISILFLFLEAISFTLLSHLRALESGSLGNNAYASIVAAILLFLYVISKNYKFSRMYRRMLNLGMIVALVSVLGTGARMAVLALVVTYFVYRFIRDWARTSVKRKTTLAASIVLFIALVSVAANYLPHRYNPEVIYERIHFKGFSTDVFELVQIDPSWETSSLMTRQKLYATSIKMFREHPLAGVGVGRWNFLKRDYGFNEFVLIDAHNGYLAILSQYGLLGVPLIILLFIYPWIILVRLKGTVPSNFLLWLGLVNVFVSFSELSNAGVFKHQIFGLLTFNVLVVLTLASNNRAAEPEGNMEDQLSA
jgi:O-antigen ligase